MKAIFKLLVLLFTDFLLGGQTHRWHQVRERQQPNAKKFNSFSVVLWVDVKGLIRHLSIANIKFLSPAPEPKQAMDLCFLTRSRTDDSREKIEAIRVLQKRRSCLLYLFSRRRATLSLIRWAEEDRNGSSKT